MTNEKIKVLYVDDEPNNLVSLKPLSGAITKFFSRVWNGGKKIVEEENLHIIITDQRMPEMTGVEFLESIIPDHPEPMRILLTGYTDIQAVIDAINKGKIYHYLINPGMKTI